MGEFMESLLPLLSGVEMIGWDNYGSYSHLLILNACPAQCASVPEFDGPTIIVSNQSLNFLEYHCPQALLQATAALLNQCGGKV
jgi:hypothetical protein